ncbi:hypothetical protein CYMTET_32353 [Cymbomonas tetramitiformis]|uniref:Uncharacterized protein n=1 Tax=Cymbomonas tetramitiformis TaxID=36881 RepID=A0AAE0FF75_9CHLO|nr:hypothetical protein CYMTET_32353 [Cymbomonas tetramitiformis]
MSSVPAQELSLRTCDDVETFEWKDSDGKTHEVPQAVFNALKAPYRGQSGFGLQHQYVLSQFFDVAEYKLTLHPEKCCENNVRTSLVCKHDPAVKTNVAYHKINTGKLLNKLVDSARVPDEIKLKLCEKSTAEHANTWRKTYESKRKQMEAEDEAGLLAAEQEVQVEIDPTAAKRNERQVLLSEFGMRALTSAHILALHFLLGCFFLACRIPFNVVRNVFFREFIKGLCHAYYPHLPTFETLRTTIVDNVYEETILSTNAILDNAPGKRTLSYS